MVITKRLIHFTLLETFNRELEAGNILDTSIVFIQDVKLIWTHGHFYANTDDIQKQIDNLITVDEEINVQLNQLGTTINSIKLIPLNIISTNNDSTIDLIEDDILSFSSAQSFTSKIFNIKLTDQTNEHTWTLRFQLSSSSPNISFNPPPGYTLNWANGETPAFTGNGAAYEITFKYLPGVNLILGVCGEFK